LEQSNGESPDVLAMFFILHCFDDDLFPCLVFFSYKCPQYSPLEKDDGIAASSYSAFLLYGLLFLEKEWF
jgi:hypothetical protein